LLRPTIALAATANQHQQKQDHSYRVCHILPPELASDRLQLNMQPGRPWMESPPPKPQK
jgi:hypothetical protein